MPTPQERVSALVEQASPELCLRVALQTLVMMTERLKVCLDLDADESPYNQDLLTWDIGQMALAVVQLAAATGVDHDRALAMAVVDHEKRWSGHPPTRFA